MQATVSERYGPDDLSTVFVHNHTDVRELIEYRVDGVLQENDTIPELGTGADPYEDFYLGQYVHYNDSSVREIHFVVNGKNKTYPQQE